MGCLATGPSSLHACQPSLQRRDAAIVQPVRRIRSRVRGSVGPQVLAQPQHSSQHASGSSDDPPQQQPRSSSLIPLPKQLNKPRTPTWEKVRQLAILCSAVFALWLVSPEGAVASAAHSSFSLSGAAKGILDFALHLDKHLSEIVIKHGQTTYGILFAIVFCETGLVLTPFLPGDSLLFAAGAFAALGSLNFGLLLVTFITAAIIGDAVNYAVGNFLGAKAIESNLIKKAYIDKTEEFYSKYGGKTVVLARFVPIVRTFAPFVAGVGNMSYSQFALYNVGGAVLWSVLFTGAGFFFGNLPFVQHNFTLVVLAIVAVSVLPIAWEIWAAKRKPQPPSIDDMRPGGYVRP